MQRTATSDRGRNGTRKRGENGGIMQTEARRGGGGTRRSKLHPILRSYDCAKWYAKRFKSRARTNAYSLSLSLSRRSFTDHLAYGRELVGNLRLFAGYVDKMPYVTTHEEAHASRNFDSVKDEEQWLVRRY